VGEKALSGSPSREWSRARLWPQVSRRGPTRGAPSGPDLRRPRPEGGKSEQSIMNQTGHRSSAHGSPLHPRRRAVSGQRRRRTLVRSSELRGEPSASDQASGEHDCGRFMGRVARKHLAPHSESVDRHQVVQGAGRALRLEKDRLASRLSSGESSTLAESSDGFRTGDRPSRHEFTFPREEELWIMRHVRDFCTACR
jgi:hypothetical protein